MMTVGKVLLMQIAEVLEVSFGNKSLDNRYMHIKDYDHKNILHLSQMPISDTGEATVRHHYKHIGHE